MGKLWLNDDSDRGETMLEAQMSTRRANAHDSHSHLWILVFYLGHLHSVG